MTNQGDSDGGREGIYNRRESNVAGESMSNQGQSVEAGERLRSRVDLCGKEEGELYAVDSEDICRRRELLGKEEEASFAGAEDWGVSSREGLFEEREQAYEEVAKYPRSSEASLSWAEGFALALSEASCPGNSTLLGRLQISAVAQSAPSRPGLLEGQQPTVTPAAREDQLLSRRRRVLRWAWSASRPALALATVLLCQDAATLPTVLADVGER